MLRAPTPSPPIARPMKRWGRDWAKVWKEEPIMKITRCKKGRGKEVREVGQRSGNYGGRDDVLQAAIIEYLLEYLSAKIPALRAPTSAPSSRTAASSEPALAQVTGVI